jgi:hypothetical protein
VKKHAIVCAALFVVDAFVLGQGAIATGVGLVLILLGALDVLRGLLGDRVRVRRGLTRIAIYAALVLSVWGAIYFGNKLARSRAEQLVVALNAYKSEHGDYPTALQALVPKYTAAVPTAKYTLVGSEFLYHYAPAQQAGFLGYTTFPPFGRRIYSLETKSWGSLD